MNFTKVHGAGNDFVLLEAGSKQRDWSKVAIAMCDRHFGVGADGLLLGNVLQFGKQLAGVAAVWAFAFGATWILGKLVDVTIGLRVSGAEETVGLDISQHGERAYGGVLR